MKSKMPEITTGRTVLIAKQKKRKEVDGKIPFLTHFLLLLVYAVNIFSQRGELKITECDFYCHLLSTTSSSLLRQPLI